jgi:hypothetical protein
MVTGVQAPCAAGHIVGRNQVDMLSLYGMADIDDVRNGVLWASVIEHAYDDSRISFQWYAAASTYVSHVLDKRLLTLSLDDPLPAAGGGNAFQAPERSDALKSIMWGSLDGAAWDYTFTQDGPKPRCRGFHVQLLSAVKLATHRGHLNEGLGLRKVVEDLEWSDEGTKARVRCLLYLTTLAITKPTGKWEWLSAQTCISDVCVMRTNMVCQDVVESRSLAQHAVRAYVES